MYIGQIGVQSYLKRMAPDKAGINLSDLLEKPLHSIRRQDRVTIDSHFAQDKSGFNKDCLPVKQSNLSALLHIPGLL